MTVKKHWNIIRFITESLRTPAAPKSSNPDQFLMHKGEWATHLRLMKSYRETITRLRGENLELQTKLADLMEHAGKLDVAEPYQVQAAINLIQATGPGKGNFVQGEERYNAKLTDDDVRQIRRLAAQGQTQRHLANQFGISQPKISQIVNRVAWRHV